MSEKSHVAQEGMEKEKKVIENLVRRAGVDLLRFQEYGFGVSAKGGDVKNTLTNADIETNNLIIEELKKEFPGDAIYSEEGGGSQSGERMWVIDPIDGSANFSRGIPHFAISLGLLVEGTPVVGAVYNPITKELFSFTKGGGAFLNGHPIHVSSETDPQKASVLFTAGRKSGGIEWGGESYKRLLEKFNKTKNLGSSALDICFLAAGRVEALVYGTLTTKDIAPALGLLREAGGVTSTATGEAVLFSEDPQRVYAANNETTLTLVRELLES